MQDLLAEKVAAQEKSLGFKFEPDDIKEIETVLRNKYCGKGGLFSSMEGGTCTEVAISAAYCPSGATSRTISGSAGCEVPKPPPPPRVPPKAPELPSLPKLPF